MTPTATPPVPAEQPMPDGQPAGSVWPLVIVSAVAGLLVAGAGVLWAQNGSAVFFEMIRSGLVACFG